MRLTDTAGQQIIRHDDAIKIGISIDAPIQKAVTQHPVMTASIVLIMTAPFSQKRYFDNIPRFACQ
jgi:hypothetical protein